MRGIALGLLGLAVTLFAGALYIASALKTPSGSGEQMAAVLLFAAGVVIGIVAAVVATVDRRRG